MKIGIYGGTYNPPHLGHLAAAKAAVEALGLDRLLLIPAAIPPHKILPECTPSAEQRMEMVEIMADAMQMPGKVFASDLELKREGGPSYTSDTLAELHEKYPDDELWLLMGTDMYLTLHQWHEPERILKLAKVCAFGRAQGDTEAVFLPQQKYLAETYGAETRLITIPDLVEISSTELRALLADGRGGDYLLPAVWGRILTHKLYGTDVDMRHLDLPMLRACSYSMIRQKRVPHVMGVEEEAARLARRWGADELLARKAGILHDCTKYLPLEPQKAICSRYGVELDELEQVAVKLLHSKTGACLARDIFGQCDEVYSAIFWHTTAKADMTLLEKIIYVADYMEPNRDFEGVEELRILAYEDLDKALLMGVEMTIEEMKERNQPVHRRTLEARSWLRDHGVTTEIKRS